MAIIATGTKTIIDLDDGQTMSVHLGSNHPRFQLKDSAGGTDTFNPDWSTTNLVVTPVIYVNESVVQPGSASISTSWKRREGSGSIANLTTNETVSSNVLTVSANKLSSVVSGMLSYIVTVTYTDPITNEVVSASADITFVLSITGSSSVLFSVFAPNGDTFYNQQGTITLQTQAFQGTQTISSGATYQWYKYVSGSWAAISGATASSYVVVGSDVNALASFKCSMTYQGNTYSDVITVEDKTDNYQANIDAVSGNVFKNAIGSTYLVCHLWQGGHAVDPIKSTTYSTIAPTHPSEGDYYYRLYNGGPTTRLMRYNGSQWVDVTNDIEYGHIKTYTWYRRDTNGNPLDSGATFATGKVIYIDGDDVDSKTVFICDVDDIASAQITIIDQAEPIVSDSAPLSPEDGTVWLDTSQDPPVYKIYNGTEEEWVIVNDVSKNANVITFSSWLEQNADSIESTVTEFWDGDEHSQSVVVQQAYKVSWIISGSSQQNMTFTDEAMSYIYDNISPTLLDATTIFYDNADKSSAQNGDLWYNRLETPNKIYQYTTSTSPASWVDVTNDTIGKELKYITDVKAISDGKIKSFVQSSAPTAEDIGDLWINTSNNNELKRWNGSAWVSVRDGGISSALSTAQSASETANGANATAQTSLKATGDLGEIVSNVQNTVERFERYMEFDEEGLKQHSTNSDYYTLIDNNGYHIRSTSSADNLGSFTAQGLNTQGIIMGNIIAKPTQTGGWVWQAI